MLTGLSLFFVCVAFWCHGGEDAQVLRTESLRLLEEQQHMQAQECLLRAVDLLMKDEEERVSVQEKDLFDSFLSEYEDSYQTPEKTRALLKKVRETMEEYPGFYSLLYYEAALEANIGDLKSFFCSFFQAVSLRPSCFMAQKIIGVLHLRLYEGASDESTRFQHRKMALEALRNAFSKEPRDISLLMKLAFILPEAEKRDLVRQVCADILKHEKAMRRRDCLYVIELAMSLSLVEEAKLLVHKARTWYEYSKALNGISEDLEKLSRSKNCDFRGTL